MRYGEMSETDLSTNHLADLAQPNLSIKHFAVQNLLGQVVDVRNLARVVGTENVESL